MIDDIFGNVQLLVISLLKWGMNLESTLRAWNGLLQPRQGSKLSMSKLKIKLIFAVLA